MNIFLIPYTWMRHLAVGLVSAAGGLLAWWVALALASHVASWPASWDGPVYLGIVGAVTAGASVLAEGSLRREAPRRRLWTTLASGGTGGIAAGLLAALWLGLLAPALGDGADADIAAQDLVTLRYRAPAFALAGLGCALGPILVRGILKRGSLASAGAHMGAGIAAGLAASAAWFVAGYGTFAFGSGALYHAGAAGAGVFSGLFGLLAWGIPDSLYAGWLRIMTDNRMGRRIPVDAADGQPRERFVGHYPRGLDLFLPAQDGVMELHLSVLVTRNQRYLARGLTLQPTAVHRFLETIDLRYDPRRPAPLETQLSSGDRLALGPPGQRTEVEFLMLPREEQ